jgi:hypothetical protein
MLVDVINGCDKLVGQLTGIISRSSQSWGIPTWSTAS